MAHAEGVDLAVDFSQDVVTEQVFLVSLGDVQDLADGKDDLGAFILTEVLHFIDHVLVGPAILR